MGETILEHAGGQITNSIIESIVNSRKIVVVISNAFAHGQWCYFEMSMIQGNLLHNDNDNVILIVKEDVHHLPNNMIL